LNPEVAEDSGGEGGVCGGCNGGCKADAIADVGRLLDEAAEVILDRGLVL
jgi:hypothetical protein